MPTMWQNHPFQVGHIVDCSVQLYKQPKYRDDIIQRCKAWHNCICKEITRFVLSNLVKYVFVHIFHAWIRRKIRYISVPQTAFSLKHIKHNKYVCIFYSVYRILLSPLKAALIGSTYTLADWTWCYKTKRVPSIAIIHSSLAACYVPRRPFRMPVPLMLRAPSQYQDRLSQVWGFHVKDKTVCETVLSLTWGSLY